MSDLKIFRFSDTDAEELPAHHAPLEKDLQKLLEKHLEKFFAIKFLASEYGTGKNQRGHIDSLGLDENNCPVIIEYKRANNENIITQGLYYLDWLLDHQAEFVYLARRALGADIEPESIDFSGARVLCVAADFSRYDERAVAQIDRCLELVRYRFYGGDILLLEKLNTAVTPLANLEKDSPENPGGEIGMAAPMRARLSGMNDETERIYLDLLEFAENLGEDVVIRFLKHYIALSRIRNFTSIQPARASIKIYLNLDPDEITPEAGFSRDVRAIGHHSSGNLEIDLRNRTDLDRAKPLIELAYQRN